MAKYTLFLAVLGLASLVNGQCSSPAERPEIRSMSPQDRSRFFDALKKIHENGDLARLSQIHVDNANTIHGHPVFLAFHRLFMNDFANSLNKVDQGVPVPYWDWSLDATSPVDSVLFSGNYLGGNGAGDNSCVANGPCKDWTLEIDHPHCLERKFNNGNSIAPFWPPEALYSMQNTCSQYGALSSGIENGCHGAVHLGISGDMSTMFAPNDPFFFLHHGMVDKLWYDWQAMKPDERLQMYDSANYEDPPVSVNDPVPGYPDVTVGDVLNPQGKLLCYKYGNTGSRDAMKMLMQEVDRQSANKNGGGPPTPTPHSAMPGQMDSAPTSASGTPPGAAPNTAAPMDAGNRGPLGSPGPQGMASAADSAAQLNDLTSQVSRLSGNAGDRASASAALHNQQVDFLQNVLVNGMTPHHGLDVASAFLHHRNNRFFNRHANALLVRAKEEEKETQGLDLGQILAGVGNALGEDGLIGHLVEGVGNLVQVLPQGLAKTLEGVTKLTENIGNDVFKLLNLEPIDLSKVPKEERMIPYVKELPQSWYTMNNLNATYAAQLREQIHEMIDGFNHIDGYISPSVAHYLSKKYAAQK
ncbi:hypothetical protein GGF46_000029 [Coemansia sp. RSA 552]|nr:hypothetical protein GGF46_000029 [Coemansia sp. RSA 552]